MKTKIYRILGHRPKEIFRRFDARLEGKTIQKVEVRYDPEGKGEIQRVDIFFEDNY